MPRQMKDQAMTLYADLTVKIGMQNKVRSFETAALVDVIAREHHEDVTKERGLGQLEKGRRAAQGDSPVAQKIGYAKPGQ